MCACANALPLRRTGSPVPIPATAAGFWKAGTPCHWHEVYGGPLEPEEQILGDIAAVEFRKNLRC